MSCESCKQLFQTAKIFFFHIFDTGSAFFVAVEPSTRLQLISFPHMADYHIDIINLLLNSFYPVL